MKLFGHIWLEEWRYFTIHLIEPLGGENSQLVFAKTGFLCFCVGTQLHAVLTLQRNGMAPATVWELPPNPSFTGIVLSPMMLCFAHQCYMQLWRQPDMWGKNCFILPWHLFIGLFCSILTSADGKLYAGSIGSPSALLLQKMVRNNTVSLRLRSQYGSTKYAGTILQHQESSPFAVWLLKKALLKNA